MQHPQHSGALLNAGVRPQIGANGNVHALEDCVHGFSYSRRSVCRRRARIPCRSQQGTGPLTIASQGSFFVGGHDVRSETLSSVVGRTPTGTVTVDQIYVRYQIPAGSPGVPLAFIHGCCLTGKTWETTPDGR